MRLIIVLMLTIFNLTCFASDWTTSVKMDDTIDWDTPKYSTYDNYIEDVNVECHASIFYRPQLIKIKFKDGTEKIINCDEYNKTNPKKD
jgi:hypothetical protein